ncbi:MAG: hypothetical protein Q9170_002811 [Blastenia crenularia]
MQVRLMADTRKYFMDIMEGWLSLTVQKDLGGALDNASSHGSNPLNADCEDDGSNLRVEVSKQGVVQIIKWDKHDEPITATLSDSITYMRAMISSAAAADYLKRTGNRVTEGTLGTIIQLEKAEITATHFGPRPSRIQLFVIKFKDVGADKSAQFGNPRPFDATPEFTQLLETLTTFRASTASTTRAPGVSEPSAQMPPTGPRLANMQSAEENRHGSQQLFSQVPTRTEVRNSASVVAERPSTGLFLHNNRGQANDQNSKYKSTNQTEAIMKILKAKNAAKPFSKGEAERQAPVVSPTASPKSIASAREVSSSLVAKQSLSTQEQPKQTEIASSRGSTSWRCRKVPQQKAKSTKIRSRDIKISSEQRVLLEKENCWLPAEPGRRGPVANVPIAILQEITHKVEQQAALKSKKAMPQAAKNISEALDESILDDEPASRQDSDSESVVGSVDWPLSSPVPAPRELPPDSSIETVGSPNFMNDTHTQYMHDSLEEISPKRRHFVSPSARRESAASLSHSEDHRQAPIDPLRQTGIADAQANTKGPSTALAPEEITNPIVAQSWIDRNDELMTIDDRLSSDSASDIEMTVPLKLSEQDISSAGFDLIQEVPATAYEPQEPFTQVKRTPYGHGSEYRSRAPFQHQSSASDFVAYSSKRRRIGELGTAQRISSKNLYENTDAVSPKSHRRQVPLESPRSPSDIRTPGIEEATLSQDLLQEVSQQTNPPLDEASTAKSLDSDPMKMYEPTDEANLQSFDRPAQEDDDLKSKAESPVLSPFVSKRRKLHKAPFALNFTQEESPKEDPSITARRHREEFFASRKNSRSMSHTSYHEVGPNQFSSPLKRTLAESPTSKDDRTTSKDLSPTLGSKFDVVRNSQITNDGETRQVLKEFEHTIGNTGRRISEPLQQVISPPGIDPTASFSGTDSLYTAGAQMPVIASVERSDLLLTQGMQSDLHSVSTKVEGLSSTEISQHTHHSGQAQSLPELMTPALSVSEIVPRASSPLRIATPPQKNFSQPGVFLRFKAAYSDYLGPEEHFVGMCKRIRQLLKTDRMEHKSLWDDFIIRHKTDYPQYYERCMGNAEDAKLYERFYREEIDEPKYNKRIVWPGTLDKVIPPDWTPPIQAKSGSAPTIPRPESPNAHLGAQDMLIVGSLSPQKTSTKGQPKQPIPLYPRVAPTAESSFPNLQQPLEARKRSNHQKQKPRIDIDLTSDRSPSPSSTAQTMVHDALPKTSMEPSPRRIPWRKDEPVSVRNSTSPRKSEKIRMNRLANHVPEVTNSRRSLNTTSTAKGKTPMSSRDVKLGGQEAIANHSKSGVMNSAEASSQDGLHQGKSNTTDLSNVQNEQQMVAPSAGRQRQQRQLELDEWWMDDNTPFREYTRLYQSTTPGKGNAWAKERNRAKKVKGKHVEVHPSGSPEMRLKDVMSWRL